MYFVASKQSETVLIQYLYIPMIFFMFHNFMSKLCSYLFLIQKRSKTGWSDGTSLLLPIQELGKRGYHSCWNHCQPTYLGICFRGNWDNVHQLKTRQKLDDDQDDAIRISNGTSAFQYDEDDWTYRSLWAVFITPNNFWHAQIGILIVCIDQIPFFNPLTTTRCDVPASVTACLVQSPLFWNTPS